MSCTNCIDDEVKINKIALKDGKKYVVYTLKGEKQFTSAENFNKMVQQGKISAETEVRYLG